MTTEAEPKIDMSIEGMDRALKEPRRTKPWRPYGIGSSELGKVWIALGKLGAPSDWREPTRKAWAREVHAPGWMVEEARPISPWHRSRFLLEKAGVVDKLKQSKAAKAGTKRERELFIAWKRNVLSGRFRCDFERGLDPKSLGYAMALPREWPPQIETRHCPRLNYRPDAWARTKILGTLVNVQLKCTRWPGPWMKDAPWWESGKPCWHYELQEQGEMSIGGADDSLLVVGVGWARDLDDPDEKNVKDGPVLVFHSQRDDGVIADIRSSVTEAWAQVEAIRAEFVTSKEAA